MMGRSLSRVFMFLRAPKEVEEGDGLPGQPASTYVPKVGHLSSIPAAWGVPFLPCRRDPTEGMREEILLFLGPGFQAA